MVRLLLGASIALILISGGACAQPAPAPSAATIPDMSVFLAQTRCADGALEITKPNCAGAAPQRAKDPMRTRRHDWPAPDGYQVTDSFESDDGSYFETTFGFAPFDRFNAQNGDGGEIYVIDGPTVRISATADGGQVGVNQGFYGAACGGTGWILFRNDAPTGHWAEVVAHLKGRPIPSPCVAKSNAYTRYRLEQVAIPFIIDGAPTSLTLPTVISEHFNAATLGRASALERTFMAKGVGRVIWEAWTKKPPTVGDLAQRCPGTEWSTPPADGWYLDDCRYATNLVSADGSLTGDLYGWPPKDLPLP